MNLSLYSLGGILDISFFFTLFVSCLYFVSKFFCKLYNWKKSIIEIIYSISPFKEGKKYFFKHSIFLSSNLNSLKLKSDSNFSNAEDVAIINKNVVVNLISNIYNKNIGRAESIITTFGKDKFILDNNHIYK